MSRIDLDYCAIGERIRQRRRKTGLTQEALAERADISTSFIGHIERGEKLASLETLAQICDVLNLSLDYMTFGRVHDCSQKQCPLYQEIFTLVERYGKPSR